MEIFALMFLHILAERFIAGLIVGHNGVQLIFVGVPDTADIGGFRGCQKAVAGTVGGCGEKLSASL